MFFFKLKDLKTHIPQVLPKNEVSAIATTPQGVILFSSRIFWSNFFLTHSIPLLYSLTISSSFCFFQEYSFHMLFIILSSVLLLDWNTLLQVKHLYLCMPFCNPNFLVIFLQYIHFLVFFYSYI